MDSRATRRRLSSRADSSSRPAAAWRRAVAALLTAAVGVLPAADELAPGWGELGYRAPAPGSYRLAVIGPAADGPVLDAHGRESRLHELFAGRLTVLSFIYRACDDVNGCPLANAVLQQVRQRMRSDEGLRDQVRLISLSFDPADAPQPGHADAGHQDDDPDWLQLSGASRERLAPVLDAYGQSIEAERDADGRPTGRYAHLLKVFLIDRRQRIRNIYSAAFLHADLIVGDLKTLQQEARAASAASNAARQPVGRAENGGEWRRRSIEVLLETARQPPLGLPPLPPHEALTPARVALGRKLFFDRRLSLNNTISCAMCHVPEQGFTHNELATAVGIEGRTVRRNAPTVLNVAHARRLFHDAREYSLEQQVWGPLLAANEMGNPSVGAVIETLRRLPDYRGLFEQAFGEGPGMETLGRALAAFQRTLLAADSPFDRWRYGGEHDALAEDARRGFELFVGGAGCAACHTVGERWALFTDQLMHNTGVGYRATMRAAPADRPVELASGAVLQVDTSVIDAQAAPRPGDLGRYEVTQDPDDRWKYLTPTLRNVALTAPYMHDGSLATLAEVIDFYDRGGERNELLSPRLRPLGLSPSQKHDLIAFLESLTGANVGALVSAARAAPIGDVGSAGPAAGRAAPQAASVPSR